MAGGSRTRTHTTPTGAGHHPVGKPNQPASPFRRPGRQLGYTHGQRSKLGHLSLKQQRLRGLDNIVLRASPPPKPMHTKGPPAVAPHSQIREHTHHAPHLHDDKYHSFVRDLNKRAKDISPQIVHQDSIPNEHWRVPVKAARTATAQGATQTAAITEVSKGLHTRSNFLGPAHRLSEDSSHPVAQAGRKVAKAGVPRRQWLELLHQKGQTPAQMPPQRPSHSNATHQKSSFANEDLLAQMQRQLGGPAVASSAPVANKTRYHRSQDQRAQMRISSKRQAQSLPVTQDKISWTDKMRHLFHRSHSAISLDAHKGASTLSQEPSVRQTFAEAMTVQQSSHDGQGATSGKAFHQHFAAQALEDRSKPLLSNEQAALLSRHGAQSQGQRPQPLPQTSTQTSQLKPPLAHPASGKAFADQFAAKAREQQGLPLPWPKQPLRRSADLPGNPFETPAHYYRHHKGQEKQARLKAAAHAQAHAGPTVYASTAPFQPQPYHSATATAATMAGHPASGAAAGFATGGIPGPSAPPPAPAAAQMGAQLPVTYISAGDQRGVPTTRNDQSSSAPIAPESHGYPLVPGGDVFIRDPHLPETGEEVEDYGTGEQPAASWPTMNMFTTARPSSQTNYLANGLYQKGRPGPEPSTPMPMPTAYDPKVPLAPSQSLPARNSGSRLNSTNHAALQGLRTLNGRRTDHPGQEGSNYDNSLLTPAQENRGRPSSANSAGATYDTSGIADRSRSPSPTLFARGLQMQAASTTPVA